MVPLQLPADDVVKGGGRPDPLVFQDLDNPPVGEQGRSVTDLGQFLVVIAQI